jgi:hypothetical protein
MKTNLETKLSDIVVLCSTRNEKVEEFQIQMIDSFVQNTPEECKLLIVENNSDEVNHRRWKDYVKTKGQNFIYSNTEYNMSKLYNEGTKLTNNEYIMYANSDLLFYPEWYYNLLNWFNVIDNLFVISPFTNTYGLFEIVRGVYRNDSTLEYHFHDTIDIPGWFYCLKRSSNYIWDERFRSHYQDNDFVLSLEKMKKENCNIKSGIAYNSRVDHMGGRTYKNVQQDYFNLEGKNEMIKKWGKY